MLSYYAQGYCSTLYMRIVQPLARMLSNAWKRYFTRLIKVLSNVWQRSCPTFDKSLAQRLTKVLPNVWQKSCPTFERALKNIKPLSIKLEQSISAEMRWLTNRWKMGGRMVVENTGIRFLTTNLILYLTTCYPMSVVEVRFFATSRVRAYACVCARIPYYIWIL